MTMYKNTKIIFLFLISTLLFSCSEGPPEFSNFVMTGPSPKRKPHPSNTQAFPAGNRNPDFIFTFIIMFEFN